MWSTKMWILSFDFQANLHLLSYKNNLRKILSSKSKFLKNIKAKKISHSYKKVCGREDVWKGYMIVNDTVIIAKNTQNVTEFYNEKAIYQISKSF